LYYNLQLFFLKKNKNMNMNMNNKN
jgi:hypothetical protein